MLAAAAGRQQGKRVLISGASIAGPALAYWLARWVWGREGESNLWLAGESKMLALASLTCDFNARL